MTTAAIMQRSADHRARHAAGRKADDARYVRLSLADWGTLSAEDRAWWRMIARRDHGLTYVNGQEVWRAVR